VNLHHPHGTFSDDDNVLVELAPGAGVLQKCGLRVLRLEPGRAVTVRTHECEAYVLPLSVSSLTVAVAAATGESEVSLQLEGRPSVFDRVTDFCYVGRDSVVTLSSPIGGEVAIPLALCTTRLPAAYGAAASVPIDLRGTGRASRQVMSFGTDNGWPAAERLLACEVITPSGNWSSYPPHKHDPTDPCTVANEELYYYRIADADYSMSVHGFGLHMTYTGPEHVEASLVPIDLGARVHDGDLVLVPYGYHGPCVAAPDHPMYYLNVLAGDGQRSMAFCDDPRHAAVRDSWADDPVDPRLPITDHGGRR
jgi:5-deoxy-glucuronate isomerase